MSSDTPAPSSEHPLRGCPLGFRDRLVPPALDSARTADGGMRLWGAQLPLGVLVCMVSQTIGVTVAIAAGTVLGEARRGSVPGAGLSKALHYPGGLLIGAIVMAALVLAGYWGIMRLLRRCPVAELAGPGTLRELGVGLAWGAVLMCTACAVLAAVGVYRITDAGWNKGVLVGLSAGIMAGFAEEILFRGLLLRLLEAWLGSWWALTLTAALFGAMHLGNPGATAFGAVAIALEAGILLGACYLVTRRLWFAIGLHASWNFVQGGVLGSDISGVGSGRGLFEASFSGPDVLTGGSMGVEGSVITVVVCTAAGVAMAVTAYQRGLIVPPVWRRRREAQDAETSAATAGGPAERGPR